MLLRYLLSLFFMLAPATHAGDQGQQSQAVEPTIQSYQKIDVEYGRGLDEMLRAGRYDWYDARTIPALVTMSENGGTTTVMPKTVCFHRPLTDSEATAELKRLGMSRASVEEFLAFGEQHPDAQRTKHIVSAEIWRNPETSRRYYLRLDGTSSLRFLNFTGLSLTVDGSEPRWREIYWFLAVED